jgi:hypothetical protein
MLGVHSNISSDSGSLTEIKLGNSAFREAAGAAAAGAGGGGGDGGGGGKLTNCLRNAQLAAVQLVLLPRHH